MRNDTNKNAEGGLLRFKRPPSALQYAANKEAKGYLSECKKKNGGKWQTVSRGLPDSFDQFVHRLFYYFYDLVAFKPGGLP